MEILWASRRFPMEILWTSHKFKRKFYGNPMEFPIDFLWKFLWKSHRFPVEILWTSHRFPMEIPIGTVEDTHFLWKSLNLWGWNALRISL